MARFHSFVVFAEMRTGSNFLESNLNSFNGIACHGEAFNPHFIGYPNKDEILGVTQEDRDNNPDKLLNAIRKTNDKISGFRYFHDHDPRVLDKVLDDPRCAKIILTRNPVESYISWKIAQETGQWKLTDMKSRKAGKATFEADEFEAHLDALQAFQLLLMNRLQTSGQSAFYVAYEDLQSVEVMNGIAKFLDVNEALDGLNKELKKQNPSPISEKVKNFDEMTTALSRLDRFDLSRSPNFEPRRGPNVPSYIAAPNAPLMYLPISGGPEMQIRRWLAALDGAKPKDLISKLSQKELRQWKRKHPGHRSFTVLRHPVARAHEAFCHRILNTGQGAYTQLRQTLTRRYKLPLPDNENASSYDLDAHRAAFVAFLEFLKGNLAGQTAIRVDSVWCSQSQTVQGFAEFAMPDAIIREDELPEKIANLAADIGYETVPELDDIAPKGPHALSDIYNDSIEELARDVYQRDYMMFGFDRWG